jgi:hypothetical protein
MADYADLDATLIDEQITDMGHTDPVPTCANMLSILDQEFDLVHRMARASPLKHELIGAPKIYIQRIWDDNLNVWVYYALDTITISPASFQTSPNHSGSLRVNSHETIGGQ